jgi:hypothetical protein
MNPTAPSTRARPRYVAIASAENALVFASDVGAKRDAGGGCARRDARTRQRLVSTHFDDE